MIALLLNLALAVWLFVSAYLLPHSAATSWNSMIVAVLVAAVALMAFSSPGRPGIRWVNAVLAVWLFVAALVMPHVSLGTSLHDVAVSVALAALSLIPPARWLAHWKEEHTGHAPPAGA
ncbi:MAG TPA: hypothetical protein VLD85_07480 [Anaeromyxobacteraceae bacterium]|nr:hypothetical protein [Anaeromyxobacteraceae bacterium]